MIGFDLGIPIDRPIILLSTITNLHAAIGFTIETKYIYFLNFQKITTF